MWDEMIFSPNSHLLAILTSKLRIANPTLQTTFIGLGFGIDRDQKHHFRPLTIYYTEKPEGRPSGLFVWNVEDLRFPFSPENRLRPV